MKIVKFGSLLSAIMLWAVFATQIDASSVNDSRSKDETAKTNHINKLWLSYNQAGNKLHKELGRSRNILSEYSEYVVSKSYGGKLLPTSFKSADMKVTKNNKETLYQIKARKVDKLSATSLGKIRSWKFDYLVVVIFNHDGKLLKALEVPVDIAKDYAKKSSYENGQIITTTKDFFNNPDIKDITKNIQKIL